MFEVKLTAKQYVIVSECIERVSAYEREFDKDSEETLKEVAEKFKADYKGLNKMTDEEKETSFFTEVKEICGQEVADKIKSLNWDPVKEKETKFELDVDKIIRLFNAGVYHGVEGSKAKNFWNSVQEISPKDPKQYLVKRTKGNSDQTYFQLLDWDGEHWITGIHDPLYDVIVEWLDTTLL